MIRKDTEWMEPLDERILEYLRDNGPTWVSTLIVAKGIRASEEKIQRRCEWLSKFELVIKNKRGRLKISLIGIFYLNGEVSADVLSREPQVYTIHTTDEELIGHRIENRLSARIRSCDESVKALRD